MSNINKLLNLINEVNMIARSYPYYSIYRNKNYTAVNVWRFDGKAYKNVRPPQSGTDGELVNQIDFEKKIGDGIYRYSGEGKASGGNESLTEEKDYTGWFIQQIERLGFQKGSDGKYSVETKGAGRLVINRIDSDSVFTQFDEPQKADDLFPANLKPYMQKVNPHSGKNNYHGLKTRKDWEIALMNIENFVTYERHNESISKLNALLEEEEFPVGTMVKPYRSKKDPKSVWNKKFKGGKSYKVMAHDELDGKKLLVLKTGEDEDDYQMVYPDEVVKESLSEGHEVGATILQQLGGNKFIAMTGAKNFVGIDEYTIGFKIGRNSKGVNYVRIKLNAMDTYDMEFLSIRDGNIKVKSEAKGIFNDMLQDTFTEHTGLYTSLGTMGG